MELVNVVEATYNMKIYTTSRTPHFFADRPKNSLPIFFEIEKNQILTF